MDNNHEQIEITEKELTDFLRCPIYYNAVHEHNLSSFETVSMQVLLNKVAKTFYANLMNGNILSPARLKTQWDKLCKKYPDYLTPQRTIKGIGLLIRLYNWAKNSELMIANMSVPYRVFFKGKKTDVGFSGEIEILAAQKNGGLEILVTDFNDRLPDQYYLDLKTKYTLDMYGYSMSHRESIGVHVHHVATNKDFFTFRGHDEFKRNASIMENIGCAIKNRIFYPRENIFCAGCGARYFCLGWR